MREDLFDLDFTRWEVVLLSLIPACINMLIFLYSFFVLEKTRITTYFSVFVFFIALWQTSYGLMMMSRTAEVAGEWDSIAWIFVLVVIPLGLRFILHFTGWIKENFSRLLSAISFAPSIVFFIFIEGGLYERSIVRSDRVYWIINPEPTSISLSILLWTCIGGLAMLAILWLYFARTEKHSLKNKQALLLASGLTFPVLCGVMFEIIFPLFFHQNDIPVTTPMLTVFSIASLMAIKKYKLLDYSPRHQWEKIVESMNEGILIVDNEDRIQYANESFCKLLGYSFEEINGKPARKLFLEDAQKKEMQSIIEARKKGEASQFVIQLKNKSGNKIWMAVNDKPYLDRKGKVIGSIGVHTNINHFKETEGILEHNERRLKQAQEVAHVGSWEVNFATKKAIWSEEACKIYGISPDAREEQNLESWMSFIHPEDVDKVKREVERIKLSWSDLSVKHRIIWRNGTVKYIHSVGRYEFNDAGQPTGLFGVCHDITEQVNAEKSLVESEENMRTFINESLMSIYFLDPATNKILFSNPALSELLGYSKEELKSINLYDLINHPKENIDERIDEVIGNKRISNGERQWKRKDGSIAYVLVSSFYHKQNGANVIYVTAQDITERKKAEEKLEHTNQELKTYIYKASHDIRGPLASILGLVNVSKHQLKEAESIRYLDLIGGATQKLDYTLGELVKAMRIKDVEVFSDKINFNQLSKEILEKFIHFPGYDSLNISTKIAVTRPFFSNKAIIETIMQNLIENAIKYQKQSNEKSTLNIDIIEEGKFVKMEVVDNGVGIDSTIQGQVFDMYFRGSLTVNGSGLGLYLVKKGVDKLNGEIRLKSALRLGTTFTVLLPSKH